MAWVRGAHHAFGIEHLLCQLGHCERTILLRATRSERSKSDHEEVEARKRDEVDGELAQISIKLAWKTDGACNTRHSRRNQMVQISVCWCGQLQCTEADVIECFVIDHLHHIGVLD